MAIETVKVQRPLGGNDPTNPWLIYNEKRTHLQKIPEAKVPEEVRKCMGDQIKQYWRAKRTSDGWELVAVDRQSHSW